MNILDSLRFVQGAVASKDFIPAMTHFSITKSRVTSYNGRIALCSPIAFDFECNPKAIPLIKAIMACEDQIKLSMTTAGKLSIKSGKFRGNIDCIDDASLLQIVPSGIEYALNFEKLISGFGKVAKFIGSDASRPWSNGILMRGQSVFATNNVCLAECWVGDNLPTLNIPQQAISELLRMKEVPVMLKVSETAATFVYSDDRWLRTQLFSTEWPDLSRILNVESSPVSYDDSFAEALEKLKPFLHEDGRIHIAPGVISTRADTEEGVSIEFDIQASGIYNYNMLILLKDSMTSCDFSAYPKPCAFFGEGLRGAIVGMKV